MLRRKKDEHDRVKEQQRKAEYSSIALRKDNNAGMWYYLARLAD